VGLEWYFSIPIYAGGRIRDHGNVPRVQSPEGSMLVVPILYSMCSGTEVVEWHVVVSLATIFGREF